MKGPASVIHRIVLAILSFFQIINHYFFKLYNYRWLGQKVSKPEDDLLFIPAVVLAEKIRIRELRSEDVVAAYIKRLKAVNPLINAVCFERYQDALEEARAIDATLDSATDQPEGGWPPMLGVPITVKEAFSYQGFQQTGGLKKRVGVIATTDAPCIRNLKNAGAVILATTNISELCLWWESSNSVYGITRNPYDLASIVGGSSGGEGAVMAAASSVVGLGSDIGGSIRMPAFFCGVFGHKPSTGVAESAGQFPECDSDNEWFMISTGPISRYAIDLPFFLSVILKPNLDKELRLYDPVDLSELKYFSLEEWEAKAHITGAVESELIQVQRDVASRISTTLGTSVEPLKMDAFFYQFPMWAGMMSCKDKSCQTFTNLMANGPPEDKNPYWEGVKWLFNASDHTIPAIFLGMSERFVHRQKEQAEKQTIYCKRLREDISKLLGTNGIMFAPIHPKAGYYHRETLLNAGNFTYTAIWNTMGFPATSVPLGLSSRGLPLGIQVISNFNNDRYCLAVAEKLESLFGGWVCPG